MENNSSLTSQSVLNNQPAGTYTKRTLPKKTIGLLLAGLVVVILALYLIFSVFFAKKYELTVGGQEIPSTEISAAHDYYKSLEDYNEADSLNFIKNLYIENYILRLEYEAQGNDPKALTIDTNENLRDEIPDSLYRVVEENTRMKAAVIPGLGIKQRSGEVYRISVSGLSDGEKAALEPLILQKLGQYSTQIETGTPSAQVATAFQNDAQLQEEKSIETAVLTFSDMNPARPIMPGETFVESAFSTLVGETSSPFIVKVGDIELYSFVYITDVTTGEYDSYQVWLKEKMDGVDVSANF